MKISPNNRIPAIIDDDPIDGRGSLGVFESGAVLQYLAEKTGKFLPADVRAYDLAKKINTKPTATEESRTLLFGRGDGRHHRRVITGKPVTRLYLLSEEIDHAVD